MRCINKLVKVISCIMVPTIVLSGCGTKVYSFEYDRTRNNSNYSIAAQSQGQALDAFSADLCVTTDDVTQGLCTLKCGALSVLKTTSLIKE